jgi:oligopeptidase B
LGWISKDPSPPVARILQGSDPYSWLRSGDERAIKAYLNQENRYAKKVMRKAKAFEDLLYHEMSERVPAKEHSLPERIQNWLYYMRTDEGSNRFPVYCRRRFGSDHGKEEIVLDQNELARNKPYLAVPQVKISPCHNMIAYTADTTGAERYDGFIKDLRTGKLVVSRLCAEVFPCK